MCKFQFKEREFDAVPQHVEMSTWETCFKWLFKTISIINRLRYDLLQKRIRRGETIWQCRTCRKNVSVGPRIDVSRVRPRGTITPVHYTLIVQTFWTVKKNHLIYLLVRFGQPHESVNKQRVISIWYEAPALIREICKSKSLSTSQVSRESWPLMGL